MSNTETKVQFVVLPPQEEVLEESEAFIIGGIEYTVLPDVNRKIAGGKDGRYFFRQERGFSGRKFAIVTHAGRRIVTRNLWMGDETSEPDTAVFEGRPAVPVKLTYRYSWSRR